MPWIPRSRRRCLLCASFFLRPASISLARRQNAAGLFFFFCGGAASEDILVFA